MSAVTDIQNRINLEAAACVEDKKRNSLFGGFLTPRKALEPNCRLDAENRYRNELENARNQEYQIQDATDSAFIKKVTGNDSGRMIGIIAAVLVFMLVVVVIMA